MSNKLEKQETEIEQYEAKLKQLKGQIMGQLTTDTVTRQLVSKYKIKVTNKEVSDQVDQIVKASGGAAPSVRMRRSEEESG